MANFNSNSWYQLKIKSDTQSMDGTALYNQTTGSGATFFKNTNTSDPEQQWQIIPFNSTYYLLRTHASGPLGCLSVSYSPGETTPGSTVPLMRNATLGDDSILWQISPWGDGTFYMTNAANGTDWHLMVKPGSLMAMSSNITEPQNGQSFSFNATGTINDARFSGVNLPSATSTSISSSKPKSSPKPSTSGGLSTGAAAAIGASIGAVVLIAAVVLGIWFYRRRRSQKYSRAGTITPPPEDFLYQGPLELGAKPLDGYSKDKNREFSHQGPIEMEAPRRSPAEVHGEYNPVELPPDSGHR